MSVNKVLIIGNLTREVETRYLPNGESVANFSLATNETWKDRDGVKQSKAEFHNIVTYRKLAEICGQWLKVGQQVYIEGKLQTRSWEKDGIKRYSTEIIADHMQMLGGKNNLDNTSGQSQSNSKPQRDASDFSDVPDDFPTGFDDDAPF